MELPSPDPSIHPVGRDHSGYVAKAQRNLLLHLGLRPNSQMLEIGCGIGRLVQAIADDLPEGSYAGFDISPAAIAWLNENYRPHLPNFRFDLVEVANARYRPQAQASAVDFRFPYDDDSFDLACSFSVFTHMRRPEVAHYLVELERVLGPGGRGVMTFFAIAEDDEDPALSFGRSFVPFEDGCYTTAPDLPERAIAFDDTLIRRMAADAALEVVDVVPGHWHHRPLPDRPTIHKDVYVLTPR